VAYKKEKNESEKALTEQSEKLQDQVTELRSENTKISTQLEFTSKRYQVIQSFDPHVFSPSPHTKNVESLICLCGVSQSMCHVLSVCLSILTEQL